MNRTSIFAAALALGSVTVPAAAETTWVNVYGHAYHTSRDPALNERNYGLGAHLDRGAYFLEAGVFKDSYGSASPYAGIGKLYRIAGPVHIGAAAFVMARADFRDYSPFLGALPLLSVRSARVALTVSYIPQYEPWKLHETVFFYSSIKWGS